LVVGDDTPIQTIPIKWSADPGGWAGLASCARALLAGSGIERSLSEVVSTLGLGSLIVAKNDEKPAHWPRLARDVALIPTMDRYGVRLRPLHPPKAAEGLERSAEFPQHFIDSYVPLIRRALDNGQICLAWRGWSDADWDWGIITEHADNQLRGYCAGQSQPSPLAGPAFQVYVVEAVDPSTSQQFAPAEQFRHVCELAVRLWHNAVARTHDASSGHAAYEIWRAWARTDESTASDATLLNALAEARTHLSAWLEATLPNLRAREEAVAVQWRDAAAHAMNGLHGEAARSGAIIDDLHALEADIHAIVAKIG
jgi:hypothetical protein